jgi:carbamoyl-phosphate synthase large subunit
VSPRTILVTSANGDIADGMLRILSEAFPGARLVGADAGDEWPARAHVAELHRLPLASSPDYVSELRKLIAHAKADLVIPVHEQELRCLADRWADVIDLPLLVNAAEVVTRFLDKLETARWLAAQGIPVPGTMPLDRASADDLPVVVKPRFGSGSRSVTIVRSRAMLLAVQEQGAANMVAQEYLADDDAEFTCALGRPNGHLVSLSMRRRLLGGLTSQIRIEQHAAIDAMLQKLAGALPDFVTLNVQLRLTEAGPRIFEINPRFSSTVMLRHRIGFRDLLWACQARFGESIRPAFNPPIGTRVFRRYSELVVPA